MASKSIKQKLHGSQLYQPIYWERSWKCISSIQCIFPLAHNCRDCIPWKIDFMGKKDLTNKTGTYCLCLSMYHQQKSILKGKSHESSVCSLWMWYEYIWKSWKIRNTILVSELSSILFETVSSICRNCSRFSGVFFFAGCEQVKRQERCIFDCLISKITKLVRLLVAYSVVFIKCQ